MCTAAFVFVLTPTAIAFLQFRLHPQYIYLIWCGLFFLMLQFLFLFYIFIFFSCCFIVVATCWCSHSQFILICNEYLVVDTYIHMYTCAKDIHIFQNIIICRYMYVYAYVHIYIRRNAQAKIKVNLGRISLIQNTKNVQDIYTYICMFTSHWNWRLNLFLTGNIFFEI